MAGSKGTIYIAGPMRGYPDNNFPAFHAAAMRLRSVGWTVIDPAELDEEEGSTDRYSIDYYMKRDISKIVDCTAIYLLEGWEKSVGANLEYSVAAGIGLDAYYQEPVAERKDTADPKTHALKNDAGKARIDLIPPDVLLELGDLYTLGAEKYGDRNWEKGWDWGRCYAAMMRHGLAFWNGEQSDPVDGQHHLTSVIWNAIALLYYDRHKVGEDDRPAINTKS